MFREDLFRYEVPAMLQAVGKINDAVIENLLSWAIRVYKNLNQKQQLDFKGQNRARRAIRWQEQIDILFRAMCGTIPIGVTKENFY
jgi:hypothetical protein